MGAANEILRGQTFQNHRRSGLVIDEIRQLHQPRNRHNGRLRISARLVRRVGHAVAGPNRARALADGFHHAGRLHADHVRKLRDRIASGAVVDIGEVEANGRMPDAGFARTRLAYFNFLVTKLFWTAVFVDADSVDAAHAFPSSPVDRRQPACRHYGSVSRCTACGIRLQVFGHFTVASARSIG